MPTKQKNLLDMRETYYTFEKGSLYKGCDSVKFGFECEDYETETILKKLRDIGLKHCFKVLNVGYVHQGETTEQYSRRTFRFKSIASNLQKLFDDDSFSYMEVFMKNRKSAKYIAAAEEMSEPLRKRQEREEKWKRSRQVTN